MSGLNEELVLELLDQLSWNETIQIAFDEETIYVIDNYLDGTPSRIVSTVVLRQCINFALSHNINCYATVRTSMDDSAAFIYLVIW